MKTAYFDCYSGISGDMTLGALIDCGADFENLKRHLCKLRLEGYEISLTRISRCGIEASKIDIEIHEHDHHHHNHKHHHSNYQSITSTIKESALSESVKKRALAAFQLLFEAESAVHNQPIDNIHLHEAGSIDAILDITGAMICLEDLGIESVISSRIPVGQGTVKCAHGELPLPAPATAKILAGLPIYHPEGANYEMTTPTGAAIIKTIASSFEVLPDFTISAMGYGAGSREITGKTNFLRVMIGQTPTPSQLEAYKLLLLTAEIDDMNPEYYSHIIERAFSLGCRDFNLTPIIMKKNRPGVRIAMLIDPGQKSDMINFILRETSSFGVKAQLIDRYCLKREISTVTTRFGEVRVKKGYLGDELLKVTPEYEDCARIAREKNVPIAEVYAAVTALAENPERQD